MALQSASVTNSFVSLDPAFHKLPVPNIGTVLVQNSTAPSGWTGQLLIDTTKLTNGVHKLFIRTDAFVSKGWPLTAAAIYKSLNQPERYWDL